MNPLISIITPLFNTEQYVSETIESVLAQTYPHWEMVIVDDGSTDSSCSIVNRYAEKDERIKLFSRDRMPKGGTVCRNIGIEKSTGDYLMFLDSDDLLYSTCLEKRVETMQRHQELDFAVFQMDAFTPNGDAERRLLTNEYPNYLHALLAHNLPWAITCPFWNNKFLKEQLKGFDERFPRLQDPEFHTRALLVKDVVFKVFPNAAPDCSYRVEYKKANMKFFLQGSKLYLETFYPVVQERADKDECNKAIAKFYDNIYSHVTTSATEDIKVNIPAIKELNSFFLEHHLISKGDYKKASFFLFCIKYNLFRSKLFTFTLRNLGFKQFFGFRF